MREFSNIPVGIALVHLSASLIFAHCHVQDLAKNAQKVINVSLAFALRTHHVIIMSAHQDIDAIKSSACLTSNAIPIMIVKAESATETFASPEGHVILMKTVIRTRCAKTIIASQMMDVVWTLIARSMNLARITNVYGHLAKKMGIAKRTINVSMSNVLQ